jgi:multiple sugar transport system ATP-binding protein
VSRVDVKNVWKIYEGDVQAVKDLNFGIQDGEFLAVLGPSGCGKSTTLRMIAGLEDITRGEILFDGKVVNHLTPSERNLALAFESYALYARLTVYENIAFPLRAKGLDKTEVDKKVRWIADILNVTHILKKKPGSLSGGHKQRVNLCRALVRQPNITLLDEPISHMDVRVRSTMRARIRRLHEELKLTTIYVTHDQEEAVSLADRVAVMNHARLQQIGTVDEIWNHPANKFVATFVGEPQMNFIPGLIHSRGQVSITIGNDKLVFPLRKEVEPAMVGSEISVGIRPQQLKVSASTSDNNSLPGVVDLTQFQGEFIIVTLLLDASEKTEVKAVIEAGWLPQRGDRVWLEMPPEAIHLFDGETPILS